MRSEDRLVKITDAAGKLASGYILKISEATCSKTMPDVGLYVFAMSVATEAMLHFRELAEREGATLPALPGLPAIEPARA